MSAQYVAAGAEIDGEYRFRLWRAWDPVEESVLFVMLNPSTADATQDDPTIRRCIGFAKAWGYGGIEVVNLFALRATDPSELARHPDPVGPGNNETLRRAGDNAGQVVCAWGANGALRDRGADVFALLNDRRELWHLGLTKHGQPRHPLYLSGSTKPQRWPVSP